MFPKCFSGGDVTPEQGGSPPGASRLAQECLSEHAGKWLSARLMPPEMFLFLDRLSQCTVWTKKNLVA